jgi:hypothetical protein
MYRPVGMTDQNSNTDVSNVTYNPANQLLSINYFGSTETRTYNSLNQLTAGNQQDIHVHGRREYREDQFPDGRDFGRDGAVCLRFAEPANFRDDDGGDCLEPDVHLRSVWELDGEDRDRDGASVHPGFGPAERRRPEWERDGSVRQHV